MTGQREFVNMLPLVCNDAMTILFMFDLTRKSTLNSIKEWYRQARGFNRVLLLSLWLWENWILCTGRHPLPRRNKVRHFRNIPKRRTRRNHKTSPKIRKSHESPAYFLFHFPFHQRPKDLQVDLGQGIWSEMYHPEDWWSRCTYPGILNYVEIYWSLLLLNILSLVSSLNIQIMSELRKESRIINIYSYKSLHKDIYKSL